MLLQLNKKMSVQHFTKDQQAYGAFNGGEIVENKPLGFPQDGGSLRPFSNLFYWANAIATKDSTIGLHPHKGFEIMSFVLNGKIKHYDTKMDAWKELSKGDVQIIRAGNGISHAEFMEKEGRMFQIWFDPNLSITMNKEASYNDYNAAAFPIVKNEGYDETIYVGNNSPLQMDSEVRIFSIQSSADVAIPTEPENHYSIYILEGSGYIGETKVDKDDFIIFENVDEIKVSAGLEIFVVSGKKEVAYDTYAKMMMR